MKEKSFIIFGSMKPKLLFYSIIRVDPRLSGSTKRSFYILKRLSEFFEVYYLQYDQKPLENNLIRTLEKHNIKILKRFDIDSIKLFDAVWITELFSPQHMEIALQLIELFKSNNDLALRIIDTCDFHLKEFKRRLKYKIVSEQSVKSVELLEKKLYTEADIIVTVSRKETEEIKEYYQVSEDKFFEIPPVVEHFVEDINPFSERINAFFLGNYSNINNKISINYLINEFMPLLEKNIIDDKPILYLIGYGLEKLNIENKRIKVVGTIKNVNLTNYLSRFRVSVAPILVGAGIKVKILESLAAGVPVVTTDIGAEGLEKKGIVIGNNPRDLVNKFLEVYTDEDLNNKLSKEGLEYVKKNFSINSLNERLKKLYKRVEKLLKENTRLRPFNFSNFLCFSFKGNIKAGEEYIGNDGEKFVREVLFNKGKVYITTPSHLNRITSGLNVHSLIQQLPRYKIELNKYFPKNIGGLNEESLSDRLGEIAKQDNLSVAIINGMGTGLGDNLIGLTALRILKEELKKYFKNVKIDVYSREFFKFLPIYFYADAVDEFKPMPLALEELLAYDVYIDLSGYVDYLDFLRKVKGIVPSFIDFYLMFMGINPKNIPEEKKRNKVYIDKKSKHELEGILENLKQKYGKLVLIHPAASAKLRSMPDFFFEKLIEQVVKKTDFTPVIAIRKNIPNKKVIDLSEYSRNFNDFIYIISQMDAVITVGTSTYHISDALNIPTLLLAVNVYDKEQAEHYPNVKTIFLGNLLERKEEIIYKHSTQSMDLLEEVKEAWKKINIKEIIKFLKSIKKKSMSTSPYIKVNTKKEKVSIIIPTHNRAKLLTRAVISALNQTYENTEIIVVDDGSEDNTKRVVKKLQNKFGDKKIRYLYQENKGSGAARNYGVAFSEGSYIKFLDDDDEIFPWCIEKLLNTIRRFDYDVVYGNIFHKKDAENIYRRFSSIPSYPYNLLYFIENHPITQVSVMVKKNAFEEVGGFNPSIEFGEDWDLWYRLLLKGYRFGYIDLPMGFYRLHSVQKIKNLKEVIKYSDNISLEFSKNLKLDQLFHFMNKKHVSERLELSAARILSKSIPRPRTALYLLEQSQSLWYRPEREELIKKAKELIKKYNFSTNEDHSLRFP